MARLTECRLSLSSCQGVIGGDTKCHGVKPPTKPHRLFASSSSCYLSSLATSYYHCSCGSGTVSSAPVVACCFPPPYGTQMLVKSVKILLWLLFVLITIPVGCPHSQAQTRQWSTRAVTTRQGLTRGFLFLPPHHEGVEVFLGLPYATSPLGSLRLMPPVAPSPWSGIKMNEHFPPVCPQVLPWGLHQSQNTAETGGASNAESANVTSEDDEALKWMPRGRLVQLKRLFPFLSNQSEDCLFLNVYVPLSVADGREDKPLPVLVFIHGEDFGWGSGNPYDPSMLVSHGKNVVVTLNFRLGILGFLNANSDGYFKSPANFALMDQLAALHWVQENIGAFGGDKSNVTLMGQGKGAAFVNFLMISNALPSGSALSPLSVGLSNGKDLAKKFAARVKCPTEPPSNMLQCLRQIPLQYFLQSELWRFFGPSDDGVVIEHGIRENVLRDKLSHYPMLFGVTRAEILPTLGEHDAVYGLETEKRREVLKQLVDGFYSLHRGEILAAAIHEYTDWERPVQHPISVRDETLDALADAQIVSPLVKVGELHSQGNSQTYFYVFEYQSKISDYTQRLGCVPGEDLVYVFGAPLYISWNNDFIQQQLQSSSTSSHGGDQHWNNNKLGSVGGGGSSSPSNIVLSGESLGFFTGNFTKNEVQLSLSLVHYFSNFIRTGNPNAESLEGSPHGFGSSGGSSKGGISEAGSGGVGSVGGTSTQLQMTPLQHNQEKFVRPKLIEWPPYDTLFKKYLSIEAKPRVRNHYRAHKISFWLHLVPELMRNGYYSNGFPLGSPSRSNNNNHNSPFNENHTTPHSPTIELVGPFKQKPFYYLESNSSYTGDISDSVLYPPGRRPYYHDHHHDGENYQIYSTALTVTIAVGCSLLILNILVFAAFYYYRDKRRNGNRGRREGDGNYGHHQQTPLTSLSLATGANSGETTTVVTVPQSGGGMPEGSLTAMDLQMQEMSAAVASSMAGGLAHQQNFVESSAGGRHHLVSSAGYLHPDNSSISTTSTHPVTSLQNTPVRFPSHPQQLKENGQILNLRHHLQQQPQLQIPMLPMPNICGDMSSVPNLQQLLTQDPSSRLTQQHQHHHSNVQQQQLQQQQQQFLQSQQTLPHHHHHHQGQGNLSSSTLPGQLPRKHHHPKGNLANLDFSSMPDAILAAAMMLNFRQPQSSSSSGSIPVDQMIPGTQLRTPKGNSNTSTGPRKSALNMKEQLLISAGIIGPNGGASSSSSVNLVGSLGRTGGVVIAGSDESPNLGESIIATTTSKQQQSGLLSGTGSNSTSAGSVANVIQFDMENSNCGVSGGGGRPRPPKRHTPTVKFSPDTFANNSSGKNGESGGGGENASTESLSAAGATFTNVTLSSVPLPGNMSNVSPQTANTNLTTINQSAAPGGQTLKSSLKKNSSYSGSPAAGASGVPDELKV